MTFVSQSETNGDPAFTLSNSGSQITDTISTLAAGASAHFTIVGHVGSGVASNTVLAQTATVSATTSDPTPGNNSSTVNTTVSTLADLAVSKTGPASIVAGTNGTYVITITNSGASDAQSVSINDLLPAGMTFVSQSEQAGDPAFTLSHTGNQITDTISTLAAGATAHISVVAGVNANAANGAILNQTASATTATSESSPSNNSATVVTTVATSADLSVVKSGPTSVTAGNNATYNLVVTNNGTSDAQSVSLSDLLPAGMTFVSQSQTVGTGFTLSHNGSQVTDTMATLAAGATDTIQIVGHINANAASGAVLAQTATISSSTTDPTSANNTSTVNSTVATSADLVLTKTGPASLTAGTNGSYLITVTNNGASDAQSVSISDLLPAGLTFVSQSEQNGDPAFTLSNNGSQITDTIATLAAGASAHLTVVTHVPSGVVEGTNLAQTATVSAATSDPSSANNSATVNTTIHASGDLSVTKTGPATITAGTDGTYFITVTNNGSSDVLNVRLSDLLPAGMTFVSQTETNGDPAFTLSNSGSQVTDSISTLTAGASAHFTLVGHVASNVADGSSLAQTASVSSTTTDPLPANNSSTVNTGVQAVSDLAVSKTGPASLTAGANGTYVITITNSGASDAQSVSVNDLLPAGMTFVSQSETSGDPVFTLSNSGNQITDTIATLAAGATAHLSVVAKIGANVADGTTLIQSASATTATNESSTANNSASVNTTVHTAADLAVTKTGPTTAVAGTDAGYTITVTNNGTSDAQSVSLSDLLPAGMTFTSQTQTAGPAFTLANSAGQITDTIGTLAAGASATFTVVGHVSPSAASGTVLNETGSVSSSTQDATPSNNSATVSTTVTTSADLAVLKTGPATLTAGTDGTWLITVTNNGSSDAQSVSLSDLLPAGLTFVSQSETQGDPAFTLSNNGSQITDTISTLAAGATAHFTIVGHLGSDVAEGASIAQTASVTAGTSDANSSNNSSTVTTTVHAVADLGIVKTAAATVLPDADLTYSLRLVNHGASDAQGVTVTDTLPAGVTVTGMQTPSGWTSNTSNGVVTFTKTSVTSSETDDFSITVHTAANSGGTTVSNTASVSASTTDSDANNNSSTVMTTVSGVDLSVSKDDGQTTRHAGRVAYLHAELHKSRLRHGHAA